MESLVFTEVKIYFIHVEFDRIVRKKKYKYPRANVLKGRLSYGRLATRGRFET